MIINCTLPVRVEDDNDLSRTIILKELKMAIKEELREEQVDSTQNRPVRLYTKQTSQTPHKTDQSDSTQNRLGKFYTKFTRWTFFTLS
jgi:NifB/MoaA-like Fe-S oxidoreductase